MVTMTTAKAERSKRYESEGQLSHLALELPCKAANAVKATRVFSANRCRERLRV